MEPKTHEKLIRAPKLPEQIAQLLAEDIISGAMITGQKMPSEVELCKRFDVSRTVVREAIGWLEYDGYVEAKRGTRATVADSVYRRAFRIDQYKPMETADMSQLYELRLILEGAAVTLATTRAGERNLAELEQCIRNMEEADRLDVDGTGSNVHFHQLIAKASGNNYLKDFMTFLNEKIAYISLLDGRQLKKHGSQHTVHHEHRAICKAIESKDDEQARQVVQSHIRNAAKRQGIDLKPIW